jgi:hypothetical protein
VLFVDATLVRSVDYQKLLTDFGQNGAYIYVVGPAHKLHYKLKAIGYNLVFSKTTEVAYARMAIDLCCYFPASPSEETIFVSTSPAAMPILEHLASGSRTIKFVSHKISEQLAGKVEVIPLSQYRREVDAKKDPPTERVDVPSDEFVDADGDSD